ncbi:hypothetical protein [Armatimonas sp.]|uniref:hypothetical protein n=1 Tax=Armatimonas sp. TaxID=1872638 RepID=UPI0037505808
MGRSKTIFLALLASGFLLPGCGGRGSGEDFVTSRSETSLDPDAPLLAAREVASYTVPLDVARSFDSTLRTVRRSYPELETIHAASTYNPHEIHFALGSDAAWLAQWKAGTLTTGVAELDALLKDFGARTVAFVRDDGDQSWFTVTFDTYLRAHRAAGLFIGLSPSLRIASAVSVSSGDTDIRYEQPTASLTRLTFVRGETTITVEKNGTSSWTKKLPVTPL